MTDQNKENESKELMHVLVHGTSMPVLESGAVHVKTLFERYGKSVHEGVYAMPDGCLKWHNNEPFLTEDGLKMHKRRKKSKADVIFSTGMSALAKIDARANDRDRIKELEAENEQLKLKAKQAPSPEPVKFTPAWFKNYLKENDLTQREFAKLVDKGQSSIKRWASGENYPLEETLQDISKVVGFAVVADESLVSTSRSASGRKSTEIRKQGKFLKSLRERMGITQTQLAAYYGLSQAKVSLMERRGHCIAGRIDLICNFWGISKDDFRNCKTPKGWRPPVFDAKPSEKPKQSEQKAKDQAPAFDVLRGVIHGGESMSSRGLARAAAERIATLEANDSKQKKALTEHNRWAREICTELNEPIGGPQWRAAACAKIRRMHDDFSVACKSNRHFREQQAQLYKALGIDVTVDLVDEVRRLKQAQEEAVPEQVLALQATIKRSDERWNKVCEALGLPVNGRTPEAQAAAQVKLVVAEREYFKGHLEDAEQCCDGMIKIIQDNWDLHTATDADPVHMLGQLMDELQDLRRAAKHGEHENTRIKEMDEALETALMETTKQAQVIADLRDKLGRAENSIDDLLYDAANLKGQKEALERALEIIGGRQ